MLIEQEKGKGNCIAGSIPLTSIAIEGMGGAT
jgi:hypothetical protein